MMYFISIMFIVVGLEFIFSEKIILKNITIYNTDNNISFIFIGSFFIISGIFIIYKTIYKKTNKFASPKFIETSKCPKCKEVYSFNNLTKGICPKCNIKTIDIEEYFIIYKDDNISK